MSEIEELAGWLESYAIAAGLFGGVDPDPSTRERIRKSRRAAELLRGLQAIVEVHRSALDRLAEGGRYSADEYLLLADARKLVEELTGDAGANDGDD